MIRNKHRVGDYLMVDDESGFTHYASEMVERWDGAWVHRDNNEYRNPQEFVRAKADPRALRNVRPQTNGAAPCLFTSPTIGDTDALTRKGPLTNFAGLGDMTLEGSCGPFFVYGVEQK